MQYEKISRLSQRLQELSKYATAFGARSRPFSSVDQFETINETVLNRTLLHIENRLKSLSAIEIERKPQADLKDEVFLFEESLRQNKLTPNDDVTQYFEYGDIIEVYSHDYTQIYGNLQFMRFCSYDLFTLYTKPFFELYSRNQEYNVQIKDLMDKCFRQFDKTESFSVEPHLLKEIYQNNKRLFKIHPKWISPLFDETGKATACVLTNYCVEHKLHIVG